jgi:predicted ATPase with chaperone activity
MLVRQLTTILPDMTLAEAIETTPSTVSLASPAVARRWL